MFIKNIFFMIGFLLTNSLLSQSILNTLVTLDYVNTPANIIIKDIAKQTGAVFSYSEFNDNQKMSISVTKMMFKNVISTLESEFNADIIVKDKYVIIKPKREVSEWNLYGTITNPVAEPILNASVYVKGHKILANTDAKGRFSLMLPSDSRNIKINIAKENYIDTAIVLIASKQQNIHIKLRSIPRAQISALDSLDKRSVSIGSIYNDKNHFELTTIPMTYNQSFWEKRKKQNVSLFNIQDTLKSQFSISLLPPISSNKLLSFHTQNMVSINIIGGTSKGLNGIELGGVFNYDDGDVNGVQAAGVINAVSKDVFGVQLSGVVNTVKGDVKGLQAAGVLNNNDSTTIGVQLAGVFQRTKYLKGMQAAGVANYAHHINGLQMSGVTNWVDSNAVGIQIAGMYNKAKNIKGAQISGLINQCDTLKGVQIGIINMAKYNKGGVSIGLFNYVKHGYHKMEVSYDELGTVSLGYKSGWAPLHLHYLIGINLQESEYKFLNGGLGLASSLRLSKKINFELDANTKRLQNLSDLNLWNFYIQNQLMLGFSWQPAKKIGLRTGLTLNHFWYQSDSALHDHLAVQIPNPIFDSMANGREHRVWVGWKVGVLLF